MNYDLKLALLSIRRNPVLSVLIVAAIGLGTGVFMILLTAYHLLERNPLPQKSEQVYRVLVDAWDPGSDPGQGVWQDGEPPYMMTYIDAMNLMQSDLPTHQAAMFQSVMYLKPSAPHPTIKRPFRVSARVTFGGFFPMFDTPFLYGSGWDESADEGPNPVVVISTETNDRLFGGEDSIGNSVDLNGTLFTIVGVMDRWRPTPLFYNFMTLGLGVSAPADVFIPFHFLERMELGNNGADMGWKRWDPGFENWLQSESTWLQFWAQLDNDEQKEQYLTFLDNYANEQKKVGRFQRPLNNRVYDVMKWIKAVTYPLNGPALVFLILGILYLFVCIINLVGMLLGKFLGRMHEVSVRRALGAPRSAIFRQHLFEVALLGVVGGLVGLLISQLVLTIIQARFDLLETLFTLDGYLLGVALAVSLFAGLVAGLLPAWRACSAAPAMYLSSD
jgi:putative ABC transport system permease protein|tara:strand:- start:1375 stop:2709 length:1335 start_codon:yes stop_codon:yes gene_type:complete